MKTWFLKFIALVAVAAPLGACMQNAPSNPAQAQYLSELRVCPPGTHSQTSTFANGYLCVPNQ